MSVQPGLRSKARLTVARARAGARAGLAAARAVGNAATPPSGTVPEGARNRLRADHPDLEDLRRRYAGHPAAPTALWTRDFVERHVQLEYFRADNAYVWGTRNRVIEAQYLIVAYYLEQFDSSGLFQRLDEDDLFGAETFDFNGRPVSRDLLDSVCELLFLERHLGISGVDGLTILDIGAGYGRLAYRADTALAGLGSYLCTDAVPESTFVSGYYLDFRGTRRTEVVPLDEIERRLESASVDVAVNIASFSECTLASITWWIDLVAKHEIPHLMIVPNDGAQLLSYESDGTKRPFLAVLEDRGYRVSAQEPKYQHPSVQRCGIHAATHLLLSR